MAYYISGLFMVVAYACLGASYIVKNKNFISLLGACSFLGFSLAYVFISAWSGFAMALIGLLRNLAFLFIEKLNSKKDFWKNFSLILTLVAVIVCSIFTYSGVLSLMAAAAAVIYSFAVWNKKGKLYRILGMIASICWIIYNCFVQLYISVLFELIMIVCGVIGLVKELSSQSPSEKTVGEE